MNKNHFENQFEKDIQNEIETEIQIEKEFFLSFPNGKEFFKKWKVLRLQLISEVTDDFIQFCLSFQKLFENWDPNEIKNPNQETNQFEQHFTNEEINQAISQKEAHPLTFLLIILNNLIYSSILIQEQKENKNFNFQMIENQFGENEKRIKSHKHLISLSVVSILSKSKFNRQILFENGIFKILSDLLEITKYVFETMQQIRNSNPKISIYYLFEIQFILSQIMETMKNFLKKRDVLPSKEILKSIKHSEITSLMIEWFLIHLELKKKFLFTKKQYDIQLSIFENLESCYEFGLLKEQEKIDLIEILFTFFDVPILSKIPNLGIENQIQNENIIENEILEDFFQTNFFIFDPKIKKEQNPNISQNLKMNKIDAIHLECDFRSNVFDFLSFVVAQENIVEEFNNHIKISNLKDFILWVCYSFKPKIPKNSKELSNSQEISNSETNPKKVSEIKLYHPYLDTLFNQLRSFQNIKKLNQTITSNENLKKEMNKSENQINPKVNNFKERLLLIYLDLFSNSEQQKEETSNQEIIKTQKHKQRNYLELQMYILFEFKRMIIEESFDEDILIFFQRNGGWKFCFSDYFITKNPNNINIVEKEKNHLEKMHSNLQILLLDFVFNAITKYQKDFDYKILFNQVFKNQKVVSNPTLLNKFLELVIEIIKNKPKTSSNKIIRNYGFQIIQELFFQLFQEKQKQNEKQKETKTEQLCFEIFNLSLKNATVEVILQYPEIINFFIELTYHEKIQKLSLIYIPKFLEKVQNHEGAKEKQFINYLIQKIFLINQIENENENENENQIQNENNQNEFNIFIKKLYGECLKSISKNQIIIQKIALNTNSLVILGTFFEEKNQINTYFSLQMMKEIIKNNDEIMKKFQDLIPIPKFVSILYEYDQGKPTKPNITNSIRFNG
ncbi:hypothetical protein M0811_08471 [Anaeramoeba ignava]|uniref:Uncharacterized protein n=1 Tax=Anaeramoeba ignava TaxID=1746090 RepID=A0A9Q0RCE3_ANAIG|nr:hypothetical protein M0811_08471 [Anaeramoeba ignava]